MQSVIIRIGKQCRVVVAFVTYIYMSEDNIISMDLLKKYIHAITVYIYL